MFLHIEVNETRLKVCFVGYGVGLIHSAVKDVILDANLATGFSV